jgi:hypothetical protein
LERGLEGALADLWWQAMLVWGKQAANVREGKLLQIAIVLSSRLQFPSLYSEGGGDNWSVEPADSKNHPHV